MSAEPTFQWVLSVAPPIRLEEMSGSKKHQVWQAVKAVVPPLVLIFEDVHWADASSVRLIEQLHDGHRRRIAGAVAVVEDGGFVAVAIAALFS